jgi:PhnB protein
MSVAPYLSFNGECREAMSFYQQVFGGTNLQIIAYGDQPVEGMEAMAEKVMHSEMQIDGTPLMAADSPMGQAQKAGNVSVMHAPKDFEDGRRKFEALAEGGQVAMPFGPTFWTAGFGMVADRFGIFWMLSVPGQPQ